MAAFAAAAWWFTPTHIALAQGCAMCYNDAAAQSAGGIKALQHGILVLLIPALSLFFVIFAVALRREHQFDEREPLSQEEPGRE